MYCDVGQWRRIRRKVLAEGKPIEAVALQESLTVEATREMLAHRPRHMEAAAPQAELVEIHKTAQLVRGRRSSRCVSAAAAAWAAVLPWAWICSNGIACVHCQPH